MRFQALERDGWVINCPFCGRSIPYTLISNQQSPVPFFYAEEGNDVLLRKRDEQRVDRLFQELDGRQPSIATLESLWHSILKDAPNAPCGGRFGFWSNVKCPHCRTELPYNDGVRNPEVRIFEPKIVLVDGAVLLGDSAAESWRVRVRLKQNV